MAAQMLVHTEQSILAISDSCGFQSNSYFGKIFKKRTGSTPYEYRVSAGNNGDGVKKRTEVIIKVVALKNL